MDVFGIHVDFLIDEDIDFYFCVILHRCHLAIGNVDVLDYFHWLFHYFFNGNFHDCFNWDFYSLLNLLFDDFLKVDF